MESWLTTNEYTIPKGASEPFDPYVQDGSYFFVAKVKPDEVTFRDGVLVVPYWMTNSPGDFGNKDVVQWRQWPQAIDNRPCLVIGSMYSCANKRQLRTPHRLELRS